MGFEWDEKKNADNIKKHKMSFSYATRAFKDPMSREYFEDKHSDADEERIKLVGFADGVILIVIFTEPDDETKRIISARRAKKHEIKELYYGNG